ncbi:TonB-dependent receptor [Andreprevotia chitinilytica]|uniref:TonB-dependent receptor n=1 Tax=Andreprevotia chitinilytica TaxID=396808 RepID=UPI00068A2F6B|nr:TonB-dependent receptor [Andreprevotia chitinilytica]
MNFPPYFRRAGVTVTAALALVSPQFVQTAAAADEGQLAGTVQDALNRPLAGAKVELQDASGQTRASATTNQQGRFQFSGFADGLYAITVNAKDFDTGSAVVNISHGHAADALVTLTSQQELAAAAITAKRLDAARNGLSPTTGTSLYHIDKQAIQTQAQGEDTPINHVLLSAPGVAQDSFGQLHVRGDHANVQYRINGLLLPEGISGFGQNVDTRFAERIDFLTGALPAQYGYRTAGVVDVTTKSGAFENGGRVGVYGGSNGWFEPSLELSGHKGDFNYYLSGSYLQNKLGIEAPTSDRNPVHDHTQQEKGFAYLSWLLDPTTRISAMFGSSVGEFEIPNNPGQTPNFTLAGVTDYPSAGLNENQREVNHYGIVSVQGSRESFDYQVALFKRYSSTDFSPDPVGDLLYNGVASQVFRSDDATGIQADASYRLNERHTLRGGVFFSQERAVSNNTSAVFTVDAQGNQNSDTPISITDNNAKTGRLYSLYLQDEWKATDRLTLNVGARADRVDAYVQESQLSPRINVLYKLSDATQLHAGYSRYFTPPPMELVAPKDIALFAGTTNAAAGTQASDVKSERDDYYDIGITHQLTSKLQLGLDAYYKDARHLLDEGQFGQALVFTPFNYAHGTVYGTEFSANYRDDKWSGYFNLAYSVAKAGQIESSEFNFGQDELDYIAAHNVYLDHDQRITASLGLAYTLAQITYSIDGLFGSGLRRGFANTERMPAYAQINLGIAHHFKLAAAGEFDARLSVINLFDRVYQLRDGSGIGVGAPQWGPRRSVYVGLSKPFSY